MPQRHVGVKTTASRLQGHVKSHSRQTRQFCSRSRHSRYTIEFFVLLSSAYYFHDAAVLAVSSEGGSVCEDDWRSRSCEILDVLCMQGVLMEYHSLQVIKSNTNSSSSFERFSCRRRPFLMVCAFSDWQLGDVSTIQARCCMKSSRSFTRRRPLRRLRPRVFIERAEADVARVERIRAPPHTPARVTYRRGSPTNADHVEINRQAPSHSPWRHEWSDDVCVPCRLLHQSFEEVTFPASEDEEWEPSARNSCVPLRPSTGGCPVFVMLPLDTVWITTDQDKSISFVRKEKALELALQTFKRAGVEGVMVDIWWGIVERNGPRDYDFTAYKRLFRMISDAGLKIQAVLSFHAAGSNVGDTCKIPLPQWLLSIGEENPDIFYTDKDRFRNKECLSLGCDEEPIFHGRTAVGIYKEFSSAFVNTFRGLVGTVITEITVGLGPAGELRYPSYPEGDGRWRFPGVGEFQCYDKYMLKSLSEAAQRIGHPEWGKGGPHDAGHYNAYAWDTGFFKHWGRFQSEYGEFFLSWYSDRLIEHAERVLGAISEVLGKAGERKASRSISRPYGGCWMHEFESACHLGVKLAGVHWWFNTNSHAAELTAGYYNTRFRNGYDKIIESLKRFDVHVSFTCVEMRDCDHPPEAACSPQGLLAQIIDSCHRHRVHLTGENALQRYDRYAFGRILESAFGENSRAGTLDQITFLRMADRMFDNWGSFQTFLDQMKGTPLM